MIDTILFDLDGTLLRFSQEAFLKAYIPGLEGVFRGLGMDPAASIEAMWAGTRDMTRNDGSELNSERFWRSFARQAGLSGEMPGIIEAACDAFYRHEFDEVRSVMEPGDIPRRLVRSLPEKGYRTALATNPLFPLCAVETRLGWVGLETGDFLQVTHYANSSFCKPEAGYYLELLRKIAREPGQCLMVGNNPVEDMRASALGMEVFLVTDYLENETNVDIAAFRNGTLAELEEFLTALPDIQK